MVPSAFSRFVALLLLSTACGPTPSGPGDADKGDAEIPSVQALTEPLVERSAPAAVAIPVNPDEGDDVLERLRESERASERAFDEQYPNHGITTHFLARIRALPNASAPVAGYLRRGSRFRATGRVPGVGCRRGWFEVPGGGFVCRDEGTLIDDAPPEFAPIPVQPALEDPLPYEYAFARRRNVPQFWRLPSEDEEERITDMFRNIVRPGTPGAEVSVDAPPAPGSEDQEEARILPENVTLPDFVRQRMRAGFYVSIDERNPDDQSAFLRTVRGGYVRDSLLDVPTPSRHHGVVLGGGSRLPLAFTLRDGTHRLRRVGTTRRYESAGTLERHSAIDVAEMIDRNGSSYLVDREGYTIRRSAVRIAAAVARPPRVRENHRWLHISLGEQTLVAYEGDTPVYATSVSTGREGFETPTGLYRIQSKHVSTTMDDLTSEEGAYQIEDVPWTMYFEGNYALHTAFWHDQFGRVRSHGCVNLSPADARWVFHWAGPHLPASWHGVFADRERVGTWVYITSS